METCSSSPPQSPGVAPVELKECIIEEVLKYTLLLISSSIKPKILQTTNNGGFLSNQKYCSDLLLTSDDVDHTCLPINNEVSKGVPSYPLYKRLALSIYQSIHSGALCAAYSELRSGQADLSLEKKYKEWDKLIVDKGHSLLTMLKEVDFELHVQEPFFSQISDGVKTIEGRCAVGDYKRIQSGHLILFNKCLLLQVQDVRQYASFHEMLEAEGLVKVLPGITSIKEGVKIYRNFYSEEKERSNGVLAICIKMVASQPCAIMASILSGLSYGGVQKLLGFVETTGTDLELLPPPSSTLLSSFLAPHNPDVKGSTLTKGARALAKHVNRSSKGYWGALHGSDSEKNRHALEVICRLLIECSWMNMHIVPPHGIVFEIRNPDGYGARWSADGSKFIGFLEPYMVDGHSSGWKH